MLLDARGHLKLTDLGLCKEVGEVSPTDEPEIIIEMLRRQELDDPEDLPTGGDSVPDGESGEATTTHRKPDDLMAMSIDAGDGKPGAKRDGKARREVRSPGWWNDLTTSRVSTDSEICL